MYGAHEGSSSPCTMLIRRTILIVVLTTSSTAFTQSLTGKWAGVDRVLDSGKRDRTVIDLTQSGDHLNGVVKTLGFQAPLTGTVEGEHFQLFAPWSAPKRPFASGELVGRDLELVWDGHKVVLTPATAADSISVPPYIPPPGLKTLPDNGLAKNPPMGWNSWNFFAAKIDDTTVRRIADAMVSSGMRGAGYIYINIDDSWEGLRGPGGDLRPNHKFPNMKALASYVHSKGLRLGIYSTPGPYTCEGFSGSYGHEKQDARTFASWGIDYLKYDWCSASGIYSNDQLQSVYQQMGEALQTTGRPIVFSLCEYGMGGVEKWGRQAGGNLWRTTDDIRDEWSSMMDNAHRQMGLARFAGPGHWNDPDMLEVGNGRMTADEYRTHMSLWSLMAAPLLAGNDIRHMTQITKEILLNKEVIAIDQDSLGKQGTMVAQNRETETWLKPLADGGVAVGVINIRHERANVVVRAADLRISTPTKARNLWTHQDVSFAKGEYSTNVPSHGILLLRIFPPT
jgi:alpha-galactosidase